MAVSDDMKTWKRFQSDPNVHHEIGITGDPNIQKIGDVWVMFYYGAFWKNKGGAFDRFACSYDLKPGRIGKVKTWYQQVKHLMICMHINHVL